VVFPLQLLVGADEGVTGGGRNREILLTASRPTEDDSALRLSRETGERSRSCRGRPV